MSWSSALDPAVWSVVASLALVLALLALGMALALTVRARRIGRRMAALEAHYALIMQGAEGEDIAAALAAFAERLGTGESRVRVLEARAENLDGRLRRAVTGVRLMRFRAFDDAGGDQSFALALLDEAADGAVVSGIHGRGGVRLYAKPVAAGASPYNLTAEESRVIAEAGGLAGGQG